LREYFDFLGNVADARNCLGIGVEELEKKFGDKVRVELVGSSKEKLMCALCPEKVLKATEDEGLSCC